MYELFKILLQFFNENKSLVIMSISIQIIYSVLEFIIIPFILAGAFNNIKNLDKLRDKLLLLVGTWVIIKIVGSLSLHYHNQLEPEIGKYIVMKILESIFTKYEIDNYIPNVSVLIDKIHMIKSNLHDFIYLLCTVFIPRIIVLIISCINFLKINVELGITIFVCIIVQYIFIFLGLEKCVNITCDEHTTKDSMYKHIEDVFSNINTVQSTPNGYETEYKNLDNIACDVKNSENNTCNCINTKQYRGYGTNVFIFAYIVYTIYKLRKNNRMTTEQTTTSILLIIGLFENMCDISYYVPELTHRFGVLKSNDKFLKQLIIDPEDVDKSALPVINNYNITFKNVTFKYQGEQTSYLLNDFSIVLPENKIISIYGQSGVGKTTFIKLIYGVEKPISGEILLGDQNIDNFKIRDIRRYIAYIEQNTSNLFNRTVFENITYGKKFDSNTEEEIFKNKIKDIFDRFGLYNIFKILDQDKPKWSFLDETVGKLGEYLSGGQKKIIHLLRVEINDIAKIIILDEPSNGLDENTRNNIVSYIQYLNSKGKMILLVTHDPFFKGISDKVLEFTPNANPKYIK
jgi:ABC-type multidrug transport system fused ATPase/permease subunit